jgi:hypothetical protein
VDQKRWWACGGKKKRREQGRWVAQAFGSRLKRQGWGEGREGGVWKVFFFLSFQTFSNSFFKLLKLNSFSNSKLKLFLTFQTFKTF